MSNTFPTYYMPRSHVPRLTGTGKPGNEATTCLYWSGVYLDNNIYRHAWWLPDSLSTMWPTDPSLHSHGIHFPESYIGYGKRYIHKLSKQIILIPKNDATSIIQLAGAIHIHVPMSLTLSVFSSSGLSFSMFWMAWSLSSLMCSIPTTQPVSPT